MGEAWRAMCRGADDEGDGGAAGLGAGGATWGGYPYQVSQLTEGEETLVALAATPMTAFAAYYAAVREHLGATVVLRHNGRVIQRADRKGH